MARRNTAAADGVVIPVPAFVDPDTISDSGSSTTPPPPEPGRNQTNPVLQVVHAGAPVIIPAPEDGQPVAAAVEEVTSQVVEVEGSAGAAVAAINRYHCTHGRIPMTHSEVVSDDLDLNAPTPADGSGNHAPRRRVDRPLICAYCNCAFCFSADEVAASLDPEPGHVFPAPPVPITRNLLTPPAVAPLYRGDPWGPGATPELLLVCSSESHFKLTMGMLQQTGGAPPELVWKCTVAVLRVLPIVVGSEGASSSDLLAEPPAPPPEPWRYAGAYWNYVEPGDEDIVKLKLHDDPLKLTLGRR